MTQIERVGVDAFAHGRLLRDGTAVVAFLADWCPFCDEFVPHFARLARPGVRLLVADVTDDDSPLWERFSVSIVPTVIVFRDGVPSFRADGRSGEGLGPDDLRRIVSALAPTPAGPGVGPRPDPKAE